MKKLIPFMLALAFAVVTMAPAFAQDPAPAPKKEDTPKKKGKKKAPKKEDTPKKEGSR